MEYIKERLLTLLRFVLFLVGRAMVIWGQKTIGYLGIFVMLGGLSCLLILIYDHNDRNR